MNIRNKCIVFGYEHHNSLGQVRSLGENGIKPITVTIKEKVKITSASKYVKERYYVNNIQEGFDLILKKWGNEEEKPFIFTSDDIATSFLDQHYNQIKDKFYFNNSGEQGSITGFMDKKLMSRIADDIGFKVIESINLKDVSNFGDLTYPVFTKTNNSLMNHWKDDSYVCENETELLNIIKKIKNNNVIIQPYIDKDNELCLEGFSYNEGNDVVVALALQNNYFVKGAYAHYLTCTNFEDEKILQLVSKLIKKFHYSGVFEIEFIKDKNGNLYFLEINFRNSAWGYATTKAGMSTAIGWIESTLHGDSYSPTRVQIKENFTAMSEFADFKIRVLGKKIKYRDWKKQFKNSDCTFYYNKEDKRPFYNALFNKILKNIIK